MTEDETFSRLLREPICTTMLDTIDIDEISVEEFQANVAAGHYNAKLSKLGWKQEDFIAEYSKWIKKTLKNLYPDEYA